MTEAATQRADLREDVPALFVPDGDPLVPTAFAVGPWRPDAVHGAAVAALLAAALDPGEAEAPAGRVTLDFLAAVPLLPLGLVVDDGDRGRRVQHRSAILLAGDRPVARATSVWLRPDPSDALPDVPLTVSGGAVVEPPPGELTSLPASRAGWPGFESHAIALRVGDGGSAGFRGWFRLLLPALAGQEITGLQRAVAAADYTSGGTAAMVSLRKWTFMSTDLTVNLVRRPVGDWVGMTADAVLGPGVGVAASALHDAGGPFGRCTQAQFLTPRR